MTRTLRAIEQVRQGSGLIEVRDRAGCPCQGVPVWVEQETHAFLFRCALPDLAFLSESGRQRYLRRVAEVFNDTVPLHDLTNAAERTIVDLSDRGEAPVPLQIPVLRRVLDAAAQKGRLVDVVLDGPMVGPDLSERGQAERVANLYTFCFAHAAVRAVTWRGLCDAEPHARGAGLLRADLAPKHAFKLLRKLIRDVWHSRAAGHTDAHGQFRFRGFFGDYRVGVNVAEGEAKVVTLALTSGLVDAAKTVFI